MAIAWPWPSWKSAFSHLTMAPAFTGRTIRHGSLGFRPTHDEGRPSLQAHDDNLPSAGRDRVEHSRPVAVTAPDSFNERRVRWSIYKGDQHATPLLRSRRSTPRQGNTQCSGVQCDGARRYLSKMGVWAFTGGKCPVIIQHLFEPSKILGETPLSEGRCLLSANGEYFKPGATRPSSEFRSPVQFAFPDTNERRSPGVAGNDPHNSGSKPSSTEKPFG